MSLLADIRAEVNPRGGLCSVSSVLASLDPDDAADLTAALDDLSIPGAAIERALKARNLRLGESTVRRHRRRACACPA